MANYIDRRLRIENKIKKLDSERIILPFDVRSFFEDWFAESSLSLVTFESRIDEMNRFLKWCNVHDVRMPTRQHAKDYLRDLDVKGIRKSSIKSIHGSLHPIFKRMNQLELYTDIFSCISFGAAESKEKETLSRDEVKLLIDKTTNTRTKAIISLMLVCGLRCVEVSELLWGDISGNRAVIRGKARCEKNTQIVIPDSVIDCLMKWKSETKGNTNNNDHVFISMHKNSDGRIPPLSPIAISILIGKHLRNTFPGKSMLSAHCLRHTAITLAIESGMDITRVSRFARHRSISTTMIYVHDKERYTDPVEARIESMINHTDDVKVSDTDVESALKRALIKLLKDGDST